MLKQFIHRILYFIIARMETTVVCSIALIFWIAVNSAIGGGGIYDPLSERCCSGSVFSLGNDSNNQQCCLNALYNVDTQLCCNERVVDKIVGKDSICCDDQAVVNQSQHVCCDGRMVPFNGSRDDAICCAGKVYKNADNRLLCCNGILSNNSPWLFGCCGNITYNLEKQICCYESNLVLDKPLSNCQSTYEIYVCCGKQLLGPNQHCCNGVAVNPSSVLVTPPDGSHFYSTSHCCGSAIVQDPSKELCCSGTGLVIPGESSTQQCCGHTAYNVADQLCCNSTLQPNIGLWCCGSQLYNYTSQLCCLDVIYNKTSASQTCCNTV